MCWPKHWRTHFIISSSLVQQIPSALSLLYRAGRNRNKGGLDCESSIFSAARCFGVEQIPILIFFLKGTKRHRWLRKYLGYWDTIFVRTHLQSHWNEKLVWEMTLVTFIQGDVQWGEALGNRDVTHSQCGFVISQKQYKLWGMKHLYKIRRSNTILKAKYQCFSLAPSGYYSFHYQLMNWNYSFPLIHVNIEMLTVSG